GNVLGAGHHRRAGEHAHRRAARRLPRILRPPQPGRDHGPDEVLEDIRAPVTGARRFMQLQPEHPRLRRHRMNIGDTLDRTTLDLPLALSGGDTTTLAAQAGHWLVLYFYPKDSTPGCTTEGIDFNALLPAFKRAGARVFGVSRDSVKSHDNFCTKQGFGF